MILSEYKRRWEEIKFYFFCFDMYQVRKDMFDVAMAIEAISQIGEISKKDLKVLSAKILGDINYMPIEDEVIVLAKVNGVSGKQIAKIMNKTPSTIYYTIKNKSEDYYPIPKLTLKEDELICEFNRLTDIVKGAGINERAN